MFLPYDRFATLKRILPMLVIALAVPLTVLIALQPHDVRQQASETAELLLITSSESVTAGQSLTITADLDTKATAVDAIQLTLTYPQNKLSVTSIDMKNSAFPIYDEQLSSGGLIKLAREASIPVAGKVHVATITFSAIQPVSAEEINSIAGQTQVRSTDKKSVPLASKHVDAETYNIDQPKNNGPLWNVIPTILIFFKNINPF